MKMYRDLASWWPLLSAPADYAEEAAAWDAIPGVDVGSGSGRLHVHGRLCFLLRETDGSVRIEHDRHVEGLFSRDEWRRFLTDAGFETHTVSVERSDLDRPYEIVVCRKPRA